MTTIRPTTPADHAALYAIYPEAFPEEDLLALLGDALASPEVLNLTALREATVIGHVAFTRATVDGTSVALLGPLAVAPPHQKSGAGTALVQAGHDLLRTEGIAYAVVLGDPAYYGRFGYRQEDGVTAPYPLPADWSPAWQGLALGDAPAPSGQLNLPAFWMAEHYWIA